VQQLLVGWFGYIEMIWSLEKTSLFSLAGGLFSNPLAPCMGYPPKGLRMGFGVEGNAIINASNYGLFLHGIWVMI